MRRNISKILAVILSVSMIFTIIPIYSYAEEQINDSVTVNADTDEENKVDEDKDGEVETDVEAGSEDPEETINEDSNVNSEEILNDDSNDNSEDIQNEDSDDNSDKISANDSLVFTKSVSGFEILIYAPEGTFPETTEVIISDVSSKSERRVLEIKDRIQREAEMGFYVEDLSVFDITFVNDGTEIQPKDGIVSVVVCVNKKMEDDASKSESEIKAFHIKEDSTMTTGVGIDEKEIVEAITILPDNIDTCVADAVDIEDVDVAFETDSFSEYAFAVITEWKGSDISASDEAEFERLAAEDALFETLSESEYETANGANDYAGSLPSSYRISELPKLRSQNPYGLCWAHAILSQGEIEYMKKGNSEINLSEMQLAYFTINPVNDKFGGLQGDYYSATGSSKFNYGGNISRGISQLATWQGAALDSVAPYNKSTGDNIEKNGLSASLAYNDAMHLTDVYYVDPVNNRTAAKQLLRDNGGLYLSFYADDPYDGVVQGAISKKIYNELNNCYYTPTAHTTNHAVTVVGWDDNYSKENFGITPEGDGAWLIRNSWVVASEGDYYYESYYGYFWMSYYDKTISTYAASFVFDDSDNYDNNYQYDGGLISSNTAVGSKVANVFQVSDQSQYGEILNAVSFATVSANKDYKVYIYKGLSGRSNPESGTLVDTLTGHYNYSGYLTVKLNSPIKLQPGELFSVVIDGNDIAIESEYKYSDGAYCHTAAQSGQSLYYTSTWFDKGASKNQNYRIKAFTDTLTTAEFVATSGITFTDSSLTSSGKSLHVGDKFTAQYTVVPANATDKRVEWVTSDDKVAEVNISTGEITAKSAGTSTISIRTKSGGITASFIVTVESNVQSITFNNSPSAERVYGNNFALSVTVAPSTLASSVEWSSSNHSIATVSNTGLVNVCGTGYVTITATVQDKSVSIELTCRPKGPTVVNFNITSKYQARIVWQDAPVVDYYQVKHPDGSFSDKIYPGSIHEYLHGDYTDKIGTSVKYTLYTYSNGLEMKTPLTFSITTQPPETEYSITYHMGTGTNNSTNPSKHNGTDAVVLKDAVPLPGYKFAGWYLDAGFTQAYSPTTSFGAKNIDLYAKYTEISYTVSFYYHGILMDSVSLSYNQEYQLTNPYIMNGYVFTGWTYNNGTADVKVYEGQKIKQLCSVDNQTVSLNQVWEPVAKYNPKWYKVKYVLNGGKNVKSNPTMYYSYMTTKLYEPTRKGYIFDGWYRNKKFTGLRSYAISSDITGNITLYAKWTPIYYSVTFKNLNGASHPYANDATTYTVAKAVKLKKPTRTGYTFSGWYTDATLKKKITSIKKGSIGNKTLYAKWTPNKYTVSFASNGGKGKVKALAVIYDQPFTLRANKFTRKGYHFVGWSTVKNGSVIYSDGQLVTTNLTSKKSGKVKLYAIWETDSN